MVTKRPNIMSFGEVLWDVYPTYQKLGGAPFNFAAHASLLGANVTMVSSVGDDSLGNEILCKAEQLQLNTNFIHVDPENATGTVNVTLDKNGKPSYEIKSQVAWDFISIDKNKQSHLHHQDILVFGTLAMRSVHNLDTLKSLIRYSKETLLDLNIRQSFYSKNLISELMILADILKLNDEELDLLCELFEVNISEIYTFLSSTFSLKMIIVTKGENGAEAYMNGIIYIADADKIEVIDTVGSGDAFLAAFIYNYLMGKEIAACLKEACKLGAYVATQSGAIPDALLSQNILINYYE